MYSTCLFCSQSLGANDVLELFPVGRRLAFDTGKGRLWVVCRKCVRWNLSPLVERWEVVEACERLFRETRMRASTENIGLARLHEGLELVRIGRPLRPEFAAWRYGDQFGRRRWRAIRYVVGVAAVAAATQGVGMAMGGASLVLLRGIEGYVQGRIGGRPRVKFKTREGEVLKLTYYDAVWAGFVPPSAADESWRVTLGAKQMAKVFRGEEADRLAGRMVPLINRFGGNVAKVQEAVKRLEESGGPEAFLRSRLLDPKAPFDPAHLRLGRTSRACTRGPHGEPVLRIAKLQPQLRLAVEMALHEEQERRALEGELKALEIAWREAEQIAAISDDLV